ncbi:hypothetical protein Scep_007861 [Stephania cephalantha]|uniref:Lycopene epsilon cyclase n=1 Tax=Stephania cephalantha TaxID=152367 RepID=A0AAP0KCK9_9MAGN
MRVTNTQEREKRPDSSSSVGSRRSNGGAPSRQDRAGIDGVRPSRWLAQTQQLQPTRTAARQCGRGGRRRTAAVQNNPYDPGLMVFMDYRDYVKREAQCSEAEYPTFLYVMPMSPTRVFFEETCLASRNAMPFDLLKRKLLSRLENMGVRILEVYEEEWSYIPVGGSLPNTEQKNLAFGAAASMVHPATGYSVVRSLSEAPKYASVIAKILRENVHSKQNVSLQRTIGNISMQEGNASYILFNNLIGACKSFRVDMKTLQKTELCFAEFYMCSDISSVPTYTLEEFYSPISSPASKY